MSWVSSAVPSILKDALKVTSENIEKSLQKLLQAAYQFTGVYIHTSHHIHLTSHTHTHPSSLLSQGVLCSLVDSPHPPPPPSTVLAVKEALVTCRQHEAFVRTLMVTTHTHTHTTV